MGGLIIHRDERTREERAAEPMYELDAFWCLTEDKSRAVPEGHAEARFVLGGPGVRIPLAEAIKYGLVASAEPPAEEPIPESTPAPPPVPEEPASEPPSEPPTEPLVPEAKAKAAKTKTKAQ